MHEIHVKAMRNFILTFRRSCHQKDTIWPRPRLRGLILEKIRGFEDGVRKTSSCFSWSWLSPYRCFSARGSYTIFSVVSLLSTPFSSWPWLSPASPQLVVFRCLHGWSPLQISVDLVGLRWYCTRAPVCLRTCFRD